MRRMEDTGFFTEDEKKLVASLYKELKTLSGTTLQDNDCQLIKQLLINAVIDKSVQRDAFGLNPVVLDMQTAVIVASEIGLMRASILSIMLHRVVKNGSLSLEKVSKTFGEDVGGIIRGLIRINDLYAKNPTIESENFRDLLLSFAEDMRVVLIMIAARVNLMRQIGKSENDEARQEVSREAAFLYAPLAHKLGLYKLKSELEDLSLKYLEHAQCHGAEMPCQRAYQEHPLHLPEDEEAEHYLRGCVRPFRHPCHPGLQAGAGKGGMLAGVLHHHRYVPT